MMHINEIMNRVHENAVKKGFWNEKNLTHGELNGRLMLVVSEIAEACEEVRHPDFNDPTVIADVNGKPEGFAVELADALIRILDLCGAYKINIEEVIMLKHDYNTTRPHMHGKRV